ncbi:pseudouridine-metabolizing bifunctional protein C1861.05-like isoform X2 [Amphibalanus amphitrite]|nr:pseudouridine-metabolizing bifunctional protein C1861.05-like isoform X2 [Amphibalanus amphitrite]
MQAAIAVRRVLGAKAGLVRLGRHLSMQVAPPVAEALRAGDAVVALESTIITHGMPYPQNLETAERVEEIIREQGAVPATVGILGGQLHVGLSRAQMERLARHERPCVKTSRRDLPCVMAKGLDGGTTVSGTLVAAARAGISVFVTGGVGGVHRGGHRTMDVSADLIDLGRAPVCCVCAGVKSILDVGRTLEVLETQGVCVVTLGESDRFPAFFTSDSGHRSPHHVTTCSEAAAVAYQHSELGLESGLLLAVPIPDQYRAEGRSIQAAIEQAVSEAEQQGVSGRDVTPFILARVNELTGGASLQANIHLVENNALHGAKVAVELAELKRNRGKRGRLEGSVTRAAAQSRDKVQKDDPAPDASGGRGVPTVIGGSIVDFVIKTTDKHLQMDGSTHRGHIAQSYGGVGRNVADALSRLGHRPHFVSAVGRDQLGLAVIANNPHMDWRCVDRRESLCTASYAVLVDSTGSVQFGVGDMDIHEAITPELVERHRASLVSSPLVVTDANTPSPSLSAAARLCAAAGVPIWFEPTDLRKAVKSAALLTAGHQPPVLYSSPNAAELHTMLTALTPDRPGAFHLLKGDQLLDACRDASLRLLEHFHCLLVTMGTNGVMISRRGGRSEPLPLGPGARALPAGGPTSCVHYPVTAASNVVNVSGAGDCFNAGFISGLLAGLAQDRCVQRGQQLALQAVACAAAVPDTLQLSDAPEPHQAPGVSRLP